MNKVMTVTLLVFLGVGIAQAGTLPDHDMTPGWTNPAITQGNIKKTICVSGYTATIRPSDSYTDKLKIQQIKQYGYADTNPAHYEEDHLISLQLGGSPEDPRNLWPQPYLGACGARVKDVIETKLKRLVCDGKITLAEAQREIATDWISAYKEYVDPKGCEE